MTHLQFAGDNNYEEKQYTTWKMDDRMRFLSTLGVPTNRINDRLRQMKPKLE